MVGHSNRAAAGENLPHYGGGEFAAAPASGAGDLEGHWWTITLSDLTMLLLGFSLLWYASANPSADNLPAAEKIAPVGAPEVPLGAPAWQTVREDWSQFIAASGLQNDLDIEFSDGELLLSLREAVPFASGKAELRPRVLPVLEKVAGTLLVHAELSAAIGGHTDSMRIASAEFPSNWELSTARASRVARYLIAKGIHPARLSVQGYADYRPREPNSTAANRRGNRRVEIRLWQKTSRQEG
jgi:flagellar motor protein MotB